jgi:hypothetical protein
MVGIERISTAILDRRGYRRCCSSRGHQGSGEQSIEIGVFAIKDKYSSRSFVAGSTTSSSCASRSYSSGGCTTPVGPLLKEAGLEPAETTLESRQSGYTIRLLGLPREHPVKNILPITFREGDRHAQPGEQPLNDREWAEGRGNPSCLGQHLARQIASILQVDPSGGVEEIEVGEPSGRSFQDKSSGQMDHA